MTQEQLKKVFEETDYVHFGGTNAEKKAAETLKAYCEELEVPARLEPFRVQMAQIEEAAVFADGESVPCRGFLCCGSGTAEGELYYMPSLDRVSLAGARDKIVLLDTQGVRFFQYKDLTEAGVKGILFQFGDAHFPNRDIDQRELREAVVGDGKKVPCAMLHVTAAAEMVRSGVKHVKIVIRQREFDAQSHNVVAEIPGEGEEYITLTAHYDSTALSHGAYDNMSGCAGLLGVMDALRGKKHHYGLRFVFCGSEERGLLGSHAYVRDHEADLPHTVLNINLDMIGSLMGRFISRVSAEDKLAHYVEYMGAELAFPVAEARTGVYSSDSTPFADKGVPAISFARLAGGNAAAIHCRYDKMDILSMAQLEKDIAFITEFTRRMADAACCPVAHEIPESVKKELDEYLNRKRKA